MAQWASSDPNGCDNKMAAMSPPTSKKETQAFGVGFWRMRIPN